MYIYIYIFIYIYVYICEWVLLRKTNGIGLLGHNRLNVGVT